MTDNVNNIKDRYQWLKSLKQGDAACVPCRHSEGYTVVTVKRVTPTGMIVVEDKSGRETRFDKVGNSFNGRTWDRAYLSPITDEMREARAKAVVVYAVKNIDTDKLTDAQLFKLYQLLKDFATENAVAKGTSAVDQTNKETACPTRST